MCPDAEKRTLGAEKRTLGAEKRTNGAENRIRGEEKRTIGAENRKSGVENRKSSAENRNCTLGPPYKLTNICISISEICEFDLEEVIALMYTGTKPLFFFLTEL